MPSFSPVTVKVNGGTDVAIVPYSGPSLSRSMSLDSGASSGLADELKRKFPLCSGIPKASPEIIAPTPPKRRTPFEILWSGPKPSTRIANDDDDDNDADGESEEGGHHTPVTNAYMYMSKHNFAKFQRSLWGTISKNYPKQQELRIHVKIRFGLGRYKC